MSKESELCRYRITASHKGQRVKFVVEARNGTKAVAKVRQQAKAVGMSRILVNSVRPLRELVIRHTTCFGAPLAVMGGESPHTDWGEAFAGGSLGTGLPFMALHEINAKIEEVWERLVCFKSVPSRPPLRAYQLGGRVFLDDGCSGRQELLEGTPMELAMLLCDWVIYAGYYCGEFEDFVADLWARL